MNSSTLFLSKTSDFSSLLVNDSSKIVKRNRIDSENCWDSGGCLSIPIHQTYVRSKSIRIGKLFEIENAICSASQSSDNLFISNTLE